MEKGINHFEQKAPIRSIKLFSLLFIGTLLFFLLSCDSKYSFSDISRFNMVENAMEDGEEIKLLYTSRAPDDNKDLDYFIHFIVVSQKTGDTVNILSTFNNYITNDDINKIYNFIDKDNYVSKLMMQDFESKEGLQTLGNLDDLESVDYSKIRKVARDSDFDYIANNNHPSIIGSIAVTSKIK
ncbi:hypothetical protein [Crocinitomix catalasitica]|uniref:hypothetical protein n=1 Tax=Crocinitomix catalasitica TaxID=184607 RepID=UPI000485E8C6|nr:hypothetical protein [Crocinitomix catalasitica]